MFCTGRCVCERQRAASVVPILKITAPNALELPVTTAAALFKLTNKTVCCQEAKQHRDRVLLTQRGFRRMLRFARFERLDCIWLACQSQHSFPCPSSRIHRPRRGGDQFWNGEKYHAVVAQPNRKPGKSSHGSVDGILSQLHAI